MFFCPFWTFVWFITKRVRPRVHIFWSHRHCENTQRKKIKYVSVPPAKDFYNVYVVYRVAAGWQRRCSAVTCPTRLRPTTTDANPRVPPPHCTSQNNPRSTVPTTLAAPCRQPSQHPCRQPSHDSLYHPRSIDFVIHRLIYAVVSTTHNWQTLIWSQNIFSKKICRYLFVRFRIWYSRCLY